VAELFSRRTLSPFVSGSASAGCAGDHDAYGINHHKQKKRADEYTGRKKVLIDAVGAKQKVDRVNQRWHVSP
jgi:hypothetical protein